MTIDDMIQALMEAKEELGGDTPCTIQADSGDTFYAASVTYMDDSDEIFSKHVEICANEDEEVDVWQSEEDAI